uniref:Uncharacterized protein n=1 Tax=Oryzias latipes TaxID=8090 RepID=A0A3P9IZX0_ORYLA
MWTRGLKVSCRYSSVNMNRFLIDLHLKHTHRQSDALLIVSLTNKALLLALPQWSGSNSVGPQSKESLLDLKQHHL